MTDTPTGAPLPGSPGATGPDETVSVAELLARNTARSSDARHGAGPMTGPVLSVGDLLRREGRAPVAPVPADVPASGAPGGWPDIDLPRPGGETDRAQGWPARPTSGRRRAGAVAGVLVAAGSVLGAALYNGATSHDSDAQAAADGLFPGIGLPAAADTPETLPGQYLPANVALASPLPELPTTAPGATDWMDVAFPQQSSSAAGALRQVSTSAGSGAAAAIPAQRTPVASPPSTGSGGGSGAGSAASDPAGAGSDAPSTAGAGATGTGSPLGGLGVVRAVNNPDRAPAGNLIEPLDAPAPSAGGTSTGPLQDVTENTRPLGSAVGRIASPVAQAAAPVGETVGGVASPLTAAVSPVTDAVKPVTRPLTDTLEPVTTPVLGALSPVTEPVLGATKPLTGPILDAAEPVTGLLDTSAKKKSGSSDSTSGSGSGSESGESGESRASGPLDGVTKPVGKTLNTVTEPVGGVVSTVTEPVGGVLGGVTKGAGSLLGGGKSSSSESGTSSAAGGGESSRDRSSDDSDSSDDGSSGSSSESSDSDS